MAVAVFFLLSQVGKGIANANFAAMPSILNHFIDFLPFSIKMP